MQNKRLYVVVGLPRTGTTLLDTIIRKQNNNMALNNWKETPFLTDNNTSIEQISKKLSKLPLSFELSINFWLDYCEYEKLEDRLIKLNYQIKNLNLRLLFFNRNLLDILISRLNYIKSLQDADLNSEASIKRYLKRDLKWFNNIVSFIENSEIKKWRIDFLEYQDDKKLCFLNALGIKCSTTDIQKIHSIKQPRNKFLFSLFRSCFYKMKSFPVLIPILQILKSSIFVRSIFFMKKNPQEYKFRNFIIKHFGDEIKSLEKRISQIQEFNFFNNDT